MIFHITPRLGLVAVAMTLALSGCFGSSTDPADIKPVYVMRNSPIPVPWPHEKPTPPARSGSAAASNSSPTFSGSTITVQKGDTVYAISRHTGVDPKAIIAANNLKPPYILHPGDQLTISAALVHVVKKGDTLYGISRAYGVDVRSLSKANRMSSPYTLVIGQQIKIPGSGGEGSSQPQKTVLNVTIPPREGSKFQWPLSGEILSTFGPKKGGLHNDGVNIKAKRGDKVKAADAGVVVYAGDDLKGYGNLLLIRHSGGWVTAYAHNDRLLVKRGDNVKKGAVIAWAGITGGVSEPQVHFEIRKGTVAVDPMKYLGPKLN